MFIPEQLPASLAQNEPAETTFDRQGVAYHYAISNLPFLSGASPENPIIRETAPVRKDQIDQQPLAGEQSFEYWWLRSQQSFHGGAGQVFGDPAQDNPFNAIRFRSSRNINVWEQGEISLLNGVETVDTTPIGGLVDATEITFADGTHAAATIGGSTVYFISTDDFNDHDFTPTTSSTLQSITSNGTHLFAVALDGVYSAPIPADLATAPVWTQEYDLSTNTDPCFTAFVKSRIILAVGPSLYELPPHPDTPPASLPTAIFTHENDDWRWTGISEVGAGIIVAGNAGGVRGSVLKLVLDIDGEIPVLTAPTVAMQLPFGEVPYSLIGYLGNFVGIGTNRGVRIGVADESADIEYGPLLFETTSPVKAWAARDRFLWCTVTQGNEGDSGLYRIDLSLELANLRFPYATDLVADSDTSDSNVIAHIGSSDQLFFATSTDAYRETLDTLAESGSLQTSRVRYSTVEPKLFRHARVRGPALEGALAVVTLDQNDSERGSFLFGAGENPGDREITLFSPATPMDFMSLRLVLNRDSINTDTGAAVWAYQLKALPGSSRQRLIQLPLLCYDWESDRLGQRRGSVGSAIRRLRALEELETESHTVVLHDFDLQETTECVIERVQFIQTVPPPRFEGWGGIVNILLRTVQ